MTLKVRILRCSRRLFIILVSLTMTWFSEKMFISTRCIHGFMSNLIKKSWTDSTPYYSFFLNLELHQLAGLGGTYGWQWRVGHEIEGEIASYLLAFTPPTPMLALRFLKLFLGWTFWINLIYWGKDRNTHSIFCNCNLPLIIGLL